jgi:hypothetical protein
MAKKGHRPDAPALGAFSFLQVDIFQRLDSAPDRFRASANLRDRLRSSSCRVKAAASAS